MAFINCNLSGGGVKTLTITVSGSANKQRISAVTSGYENNNFTGFGTVTLSINDQIIEDVPIKIQVNSLVDGDIPASERSYIRVNLSGSSIVSI